MMMGYILENNLDLNIWLGEHPIVKGVVMRAEPQLVEKKSQTPWNNYLVRKLNPHWLIL